MEKSTSVNSLPAVSITVVLYVTGFATLLFFARDLRRKRRDPFAPFRDAELPLGPERRDVIYQELLAWFERQPLGTVHKQPDHEAIIDGRFNLRDLADHLAKTVLQEKRSA